MFYWKNIVFAAALMVSSFGTVAYAQSQGQPYHPTVVQPQGAKISPEQAVSVAQKKGRVLSVKAIEDNGQWRYRVKVLNHLGQVSVVFVDATNGQLISP